MSICCYGYYETQALLCDELKERQSFCTPSTRTLGPFWVQRVYLSDSIFLYIHIVLWIILFYIMTTAASAPNAGYVRAIAQTSLEKAARKISWQPNAAKP